VLLYSGTLSAQPVFQASPSSFLSQADQECKKIDSEKKFYIVKKKHPMYNAETESIMLYHFSQLNEKDRRHYVVLEALKL